MSSTFRRSSRITPDLASTVTTGSTDTLNISKLQMKGTKIWTNGCTLVSTGLRELDAIFISNTGSSGGGSMGGQPLGTCICLESSDRFWSTLSTCIVRYWCAEVCRTHSTLFQWLSSSYFNRCSNFF
jgi:hypothetical protein